MTIEKPSIEAVRALEAWIYHHGTPEHLLTFQGILRSHEDMRAALSSPPADDVREALAEAWDEGHAAYRDGDYDPALQTYVEGESNPYRGTADVRLRGTVTDAEEEVSRFEQIAAGVEASRQTITDTFAKYVDHLGVDANEEHDGEWWDGYRQAQRDNIRRANAALEAARGAGVSAENTTPTNHTNRSNEGENR